MLSVPWHQMHKDGSIEALWGITLGNLNNDIKGDVPILFVSPNLNAIAVFCYIGTLHYVWQNPTNYSFPVFFLTK